MQNTKRKPSGNKIVKKAETRKTIRQAQTVQQNARKELRKKQVEWLAEIFETWGNAV